MGLLSSIVSFFKLKNNKENFKENNKDILTITAPFFSGNQNPEFNITFMSTVNMHAKHISKAQPKVVLNGELVKSKAYLNNLLSLKPNPVQSAPSFWKTMGTSYFLNNVAIAWIEYDDFNIKEPIKAIWPLDLDKNILEFRVDENTKIYASFLIEGKRKYASYDDLIILVREVTPSSFPFAKRNKAIDTVLKVIQTNYEGMDQAIRYSAFIRFLVTSTTSLSENAKKERAKYFAETYLGKDSSGIFYVDAAEQVTQINSAAKYVLENEFKDLKNDIYNYLTTTEKMVQADYNEDQWQSYYESNAEVFFIEAEAELSNKILSFEEIKKGIRIVIDANRLQAASLKTRKSIADTYMRLPVYKPNVVCQLLYLPLLENGDKEFGNLNYVDASKQNEYQEVGNEEQKEN